MAVAAKPWAGMTTLYAWGHGEQSALGVGADTANKAAATVLALPLAASPRVVSIATDGAWAGGAPSGPGATLVLFSNGVVAAFGRQPAGQLANGQMSKLGSPTQVWP